MIKIKYRKRVSIWIFRAPAMPKGWQLSSLSYDQTQQRWTTSAKLQRSSAKQRYVGWSPDPVHDTWRLANFYHDARGFAWSLELELVLSITRPVDVLEMLGVLSQPTAGASSESDGPTVLPGRFNGELSVISHAVRERSVLRLKNDFALWLDTQGSCTSVQDAFERAVKGGAIHLQWWSQLVEEEAALYGIEALVRVAPRFESPESDQHEAAEAKQRSEVLKRKVEDDQIERQRRQEIGESSHACQIEHLELQGLLDKLCLSTALLETQRKQVTLQRETAEDTIKIQLAQQQLLVDAEQLAATSKEIQAKATLKVTELQVQESAARVRADRDAEQEASNNRERLSRLIEASEIAKAQHELEKNKLRLAAEIDKHEHELEQSTLKSAREDLKRRDRLKDQAETVVSKRLDSMSLDELRSMLGAFPRPSGEEFPHALARLRIEARIAGETVSTAVLQRLGVPWHIRAIHDLIESADVLGRVSVVYRAAVVSGYQTRDLNARPIKPVRTDSLLVPLGSAVEIEIAPTVDGYLTLLDFGTSGRVWLMSPRPGQLSVQVSKGQRYNCPGEPLLPKNLIKDGRIVVTGATGRERVAALVTREPMAEDLVQLCAGDTLFGLLNEPALVQLAERLQRPGLILGAGLVDFEVISRTQIDER